MTDKEIYETANVSKSHWFKCKKMVGFPHSGNTEEKIAFIVMKKDNNRGRTPDKAKKNIVTDHKGLDIAYRRELADLAKVEQSIHCNQEKIIEERDEKFVELLYDSINGILEDCKECQMTKKQLNFLQDAIGERIKTLSDALKELRQA